MTLDSQALNWVEEMSSQYNFYMFVDSIMTITVLSWLFFFKVYGGVIINQINSESVKASLYTVEVKGLPATREEGAPNEGELLRHFSQFGKVNTVSFIRNTGDLLDIYQGAQGKL
jgi:hypothetical protein